MKGHITEKEFKYFSYEFKKSCNLGKLYLLPKIHKSLENVPGRPHQLMYNIVHWGSNSKPLYSEYDALQPFKPYALIKYLESFKSIH